jgi:hypothetical protein
VLIDPSQKTYSENLQNILEKEHLVQDLILGSSEKVYGVAGYPSPNNKPRYTNDPNAPAPRDCVDIAVKIAFELNEQQKKPGVPLGDVETNMLRQISNEPKHAVHLMKMGKVIIRDLQSSNFETRVETMKKVQTAASALGNFRLQADKIKTYSDLQNIVQGAEILQKYC